MVSQMSWIFLAYHSKSGPFLFSHLEHPVIWPDSSASLPWHTRNIYLHPYLCFSSCLDGPPPSSLRFYFLFPCKSIEILLKPTCSVELSPGTLALATSPISEPLALIVLMTPLYWAQSVVAGCWHLICPASLLCWEHVFYFAVFPEHFQSLGW